MQEKPTSELDEMLEGMKPEELAGFYKKNSSYLADEKKAFYYYFKDLTEERRIFLKDVYTFAGVTESYGSKIITMTKHTKNRDLILRLCIAARFHVEEINRALKLYGMKPLYAKDKRDACIIVAVKNKMRDLADIDDFLDSQGFAKLSKDE